MKYKSLLPKSVYRLSEFGSTRIGLGLVSTSSLRVGYVSVFGVGFVFPAKRDPSEVLRRCVPQGAGRINDNDFMTNDT
jgi:hypothetical protein